MGSDKCNWDGRPTSAITESSLSGSTRVIMFCLDNLVTLGMDRWSSSALYLPRTVLLSLHL